MVSAHWGNENHHTPNKTQKKYAQLFANEGVDVVHWHASTCDSTSKVG